MSEILSNSNYSPDVETSWNRIPVGLNVTGETLLWDIQRKADALISGRNGAGKTTFLLMLEEHFRKHPNMWKSELVTIAPQDIPDTYTGSITSDIAQIAEKIEEIRNLVDDRLTSSASGDEGHLALMVDEAYYLLTATNFVKGNKTVDNITRNLETIAVHGDTVGVHLILTTQKPDVNVFTHKLRDNLSLRIGFAKMDRKSSLLSINSASGTTTPDTPGVGLILLNNSTTLFKAFKPKE
jgi:DNA segregation ATPase FtsK/SpoIIIE-like protein